MSLSAHLDRALDHHSNDQTTLPIRHFNDEVSILKSFLRDMEYVPLTIEQANEKLESAMRTEMEARKIHCPRLENSVHLAASLVEVAYQDCGFEEKKNTALLNWYLLYIDETAPKDSGPFSVFQQRFIQGKPQLDPVLDALVVVLLRMWEYYDPLCANSIILSVMDFVSTICIESDVEAIPIVRGAARFPTFIRECTGVGVGYALAIFTKKSGLHVLDYIQAVPDMEYWINVVNDILSFHKEELAGDEYNYVHKRARLGDKTPLQVLAEMKDEMRSSRNVIHAALAHSPAALKAWRTFEQGYIDWHLTQDRYKLRDLGL